MSKIQQLLAAPVKTPVRPAQNLETMIFADKQDLTRNGYFYHFELATGVSFIGLFDTQKREAFFRPVSHLDELKNLQEIHYFSKYYYHRPELMARVVLTKDCPASESEEYHSLFDAEIRNLSDSDSIFFQHHGLGQMAKKMFGPLEEIEMSKIKGLRGQKALKAVLNGQTTVQPVKERG